MVVANTTENVRCNQLQRCAFDCVRDTVKPFIITGVLESLNTITVADAIALEWLHKQSYIKCASRVKCFKDHNIEEVRMLFKNRFRRAQDDLRRVALFTEESVADYLSTPLSQEAFLQPSKLVKKTRTRTPESAATTDRQMVRVRDNATNNARTSKITHRIVNFALPPPF
jgi:hypothetical protein